MNFRFTITPSCQFKARVVAICLCWYVISSASSITNKVLLQSYPYPTTLALSNLMWVPIYSIPLLRMWECKVVKLTPVQYNKYLTPISAGKALAVVSAYFSLWKVPVSYAHTGLFVTVTNCCWSGGSVSHRAVIFFLACFLALLSTFTYSLLNILVKKSPISIRFVYFGYEQPRSASLIMVFPFAIDTNDARSLGPSLMGIEIPYTRHQIYGFCAF
ncbi:hypothetical protein OSTOST_16391 [Ostertagia ostertagi]